MSRDLLERHTLLRVLVLAVTIVAVIYAGGMMWGVVAHYQTIVLLLFLAWIVAFILQPIMAWLQRVGMKRIFAVALIYATLLVAAVGSIILAIPTMQVQFTRLTKSLGVLLSPSNVRALAAQVAALLQSMGLSAHDANALVDQVARQVPAWTSGLASNAIATAEGMLGTVATLVFDAVLVAIISFYIMLDGDRLFEQLVRRMPPAWIADVRLFQRHVEQIFGGFLRAAVIIGALYTALNWIILAALGQPGGIIFAVLAGALLLVPFVGSFAALAPPFLLVLLSSPEQDVVRNLVILVVALIIAQQITMQVVAPRVMSAHVGLHPLVFFVALLVGIQEAGVWGALFSAPVAAVGVAMFDTFFERWQRGSSLYPNIPPAAPPEPERPPDGHDRAATPGALGTDAGVNEQGAAANGNRSHAGVA